MKTIIWKVPIELDDKEPFTMVLEYTPVDNPDMDEEEE